MKKYFLLLLAFSLATLFKANAFNNQATISKVIDSNTVNVIHNNKTFTIKLRCSISPTFKDKGSSYHFVMLSKLKIQNLLKENDTVYIVPYYANQANQIIAYIYKQGININEELLKSGYAKASNEDCTKNEILLANNAKENKLGLWKYSNYIKKK